MPGNREHNQRDDTVRTTARHGKCGSLHESLYPDMYWDEYIKYNQQLVGSNISISPDSQLQYSAVYVHHTYHLVKWTKWIDQ